jgi:DNA polymerase elongation subunit (family B)
MDLETILINNVHIPYLLCWYDGTLKGSYSYFIKNLNLSQLEDNILDMITRAMLDINRKKYKGYRIYLHNFAKFDGYFLLKYLSQIGHTSPIIHKGRIISTKFSLKDSKYEVTFMDSLLMLPVSLRALCNSFSVETIQSIFPFKLQDINYKGFVPDYNLFDGISLLEYNNYKDQYKDKIWDFREEAIKYCNIDCISLYEILSKFNQLIFNQFKFNIVKYPTLSSLAFAIFRTHFLVKDEDIPKDVYNEKGNVIKSIYSNFHMLSGVISDKIRQGYTGGAVDMYIPKPPAQATPLILEGGKGVKIYAYDINSLYPFVMKEYPYPIGTPTYFEGNILKIENNPFGFFYCKIIAPDNLLHPILQTHIKTKDGIRIISPLGSWEGMYFSEELYNAQKFGYKFEILWGYTFQKGFIFKDYIDNLYNLRLQYPKDNPMNLICKLLLNSLYGRFGMDDSFIFSQIISKKDYPNFEKQKGFKESIQDLIELGDNYLVQLKNPQVGIKTDLDNGFETHNVNIAIAAAVTAYARIHMSQFKNNPLLPNLYYSDTDSCYFDSPLPFKPNAFQAEADHFISSTVLGKLKLEGIYDKTLFLAPKVYALENSLIGESVTKIKGLTKESIINNNITLDSLELLLNKDYKLVFNQNKWFKHISVANISV